jgi:preprotein translocase subunit SecE
MAIIMNDSVNSPNMDKAAPADARKTWALPRFLREVRAELKKTDWPSRDELTKAVIVIAITILVVAFFLLVADTVAAQLSGWLFKAPASGVPVR